MSGADFIASVASDVKAGKRRRCTVRSFLREYGFKRRGSDVVALLRKKLARQGLTTSPDFATAEFDSFISFQLRNQLPTVPKETEGSPTDSGSEVPPGLSVALKPLDWNFKVPTPQTGYRILFKDYETYERALKEVESAAPISNRGQNGYRFDRDEYPFYISLSHRSIRESRVPDLHRFLVELVGRLAKGDKTPGSEAAANDKPEVLVAEPPSPANLDAVLEERIAERVMGAIGGLQATLEDAMVALKSDLQLQVEELRHESIRKLAAAQNNEDLTKLIDEEHSRFAEEIAAYKALIEEATERELELSARNQQLEQDRDDLAAAREPADAFSTMEAVILLFKELAIGDPIEVLPSAIASARKLASTRRREALRLLLTLRELSWTLYRMGGNSGPLREWFAARGYEYAAQDSETTTTRFGEERKFMVDGERVLFQEHVTNFENSPDCFQVYFRRCSDKGLVQIGYFGAHLRIASR